MAILETRGSPIPFSSSLSAVAESATGAAAAGAAEVPEWRRPTYKAAWRSNGDGATDADRRPLCCPPP